MVFEQFNIVFPSNVRFYLGTAVLSADIPAHVDNGCDDIFACQGSFVNDRDHG